MVRLLRALILLGSYKRGRRQGINSQVFLISFVPLWIFLAKPATFQRPLRWLYYKLLISLVKEDRILFSPLFLCQLPPPPIELVAAKRALGWVFLNPFFIPPTSSPPTLSRMTLPTLGSDSMWLRTKHGLNSLPADTQHIDFSFRMVNGCLENT